METYQIKYLTHNSINKSLKLLRSPKLFKLYYNEYFKAEFSNQNIDNYILSYPKSGRTWLYEILNLYSIRQNNNFVNNRKVVKFENKLIKFTHDCSDPNPYPVKSSNLELKNKKLIDKKKIILLRDPSEIITSFWYQMTFREKTYKKNISEFIDDEYLGIEKIIFFFNLLDSKILGNFKIITYKQLVKNTFEEIVKLVSFFNLKVDEKIISECIEKCSFDKLQKREMARSNKVDIKSMKFRKGTSGNINDDLSELDLIKINNKIKNKLNLNFKKILNLDI